MRKIRLKIYGILLLSGILCLPKIGYAAVVPNKDGTEVIHQEGNRVTLSLKNATIKDNIDKNGCIKPIEVKYKNGLTNKEWAFRNNDGDSIAYIYSTTDNTYSNELIDKLNDNSFIYYIGAYDVFVGVYLDEPLKIDDSCKKYIKHLL